ncbi:hydroxymethylglutaryl-CoA synthase [Alloscardovia macacae]|uniref:Hydroxymethylglutaryl-CoA synthase n=1 Tax=Alloscardovia macacae TaxID=1160091 RepID=A0A261F6M1_9BIFI|nr:hydroxymethylglutaryl-CoA synthase [Alloscardovia macacae]OZG54546.1 hydroxymethylglutaryl-CoA synthase [Alloscardovia macacae]
MKPSRGNIGIDRISMYTPAYYLDVRELAEARGVDPDKYTIGIGQDEQAVIPSSQDAVTMGAAAAADLLAYIDPERLGLVILGTESGVDASKAGALYIHELLGLPHTVRVMEIKEACYGGTAGLLTARDYVAAHPGAQALVIASDVARYGLATGGEVTQGGGAVAMLVSENPRILALSADSTVYSESIQDFWRPVYTDEAQARGKYSTEQYLEFFARVWGASGLSAADCAAVLFHLPYTKMGAKALARLAELDAVSDELRARFQSSIAFSRRVGNLYTASLYLGLLSLLCSSPAFEGQLALFSYGSGAVGELFTGRLVEGYEKFLPDVNALLDARRKVSVGEYENIFRDAVPYGPEDYATNPDYYCGPFVLTGVVGMERQYARREE